MQNTEITENDSQPIVTKSESNTEEAVVLLTPTKSSSKKFIQYLLEGFMVFIAVSLGFIAENIRDRFNNQEIEKRNIELVLENLSEDVEKVTLNITYNESKVKALDTLIHLINLNNFDTLYSNRFSYLVTKCIYNSSFFSNTAAIDQMKSSGSLRLINNQTVLRSIFQYEAINKRLATIRADLDINDEKLVDYASTFLNMQVVASTRGISFLNKNTKHDHWKDYYNKKNIFTFLNHAVLYKSLLELIWIPQLKKLQKNAQEMTIVLKKEYNFNE